MTWIPALIALAGLCTSFDTPPDEAETVAPAPPSAEQLLEHVVVIGASASEGFGLRGELGAEAPLALFIDAAWAKPREASQNLASSRFFMNPLDAGAKQHAAVKSTEVSLLVAVDFLFWYGYGYHDSEAQRLATLEKGLELLDKIGGPMLVGDFPDMRPALEGEGMFGGPVIASRQIPEPQTITRLNARLDEWSKERPNVMRVPLADFVTRLQTKQELALRGMSWSPEECGRLLQKDLLHPTAEGTAALALLCLDALERRYATIEPDLVQWDANAVLDRVRKATAEERAKAEAKQAAREERLRKLDERKKAREQREDEEDDSGAERDAA